MQFEPSTWALYGDGGNVMDPADAIPAAARLLAASGAPGNLQQAIFAYNHSPAYVQLILSQAARYANGALRPSRPPAPPGRSSPSPRPSSASPTGTGPPAPTTTTAPAWP